MKNYININNFKIMEIFNVKSKRLRLVIGFYVVRDVEGSLVMYREMI